ncbi:trichohyalin-like isoform X2 [Saccostrea echinata]|uniref:trichohyalin-like isoform X2 n=1 Tax=Saccostrea echinata TaxID=191078 RepID=UPI002A7FEA87|nr:trichohyalin-like isoform X2 [Saccostrea echinata]
MVLTDLPFERNALIHSRYNAICRPGSAPPFKADEETHRSSSKDYAAFLKDQERKVGPEGFLDSNRYSHSFLIKKDATGRRRAASVSGQPSVVTLTSRIEQDKKGYQRRIKVIEDHMWQHKQEERELKRTEGDIIKNQRAVRHTLRDFENAINKKRMAEEKKLSQGLEKYTVLRRDHVHKKEERTKERTRKTILENQEYNQESRKAFLHLSDLSRQYKAKMSELELKRMDVMRMSSDYETKMKKKEEEQFRLKQELADLAIKLNMEAQKGRKQKFDMEKEKKKEQTNKIQEDLTAEKTVENKLMRSDGDTKAAESTKRKLSADLTVTKSHLDIKKRDEQRHLTDTQFRLVDNSNIQKQLNEAAEYAEMDLKAKQIDKNVEAHNMRRIHLMNSSLKARKEKGAQHEEICQSRFKKRFNDKQRLEHEDSLKFFQKMVTKGDDLEHSLYNKMRNAEYARQKQEQTVRRMQQQLAELKRKNAIRVKNELAETYREETELEQSLVREKAELDKVHAQREESYEKLQKHRQMLKEDKHILKEHEREHTRLLRIGAKTDTATEAY